jgi:hypothetical protein
MEAAWSSEWPTESGYYWFYGYRDAQGKRYDEKKGENAEGPLLYTALVRGPKLVVCAGSFLFRDGAEGLWYPLSVPTLPDGTAPTSGKV